MGCEQPNRPLTQSDMICQSHDRVGNSSITGGTPCLDNSAFPCHDTCYAIHIYNHCWFWLMIFLTMTTKQHRFNVLVKDHVSLRHGTSWVSSLLCQPSHESRVAVGRTKPVESQGSPRAQAQLSQVMAERDRMIEVWTWDWWGAGELVGLMMVSDG